MMPVQAGIIGSIGIHRAIDAPNFDAEDKRRLGLLLPHLSRAMHMHRRLAGLTSDRCILVDALEKLAVGVIAVDSMARMRFANTTAERLLRTGAGLICRQGQLRATDPMKDKELRRLISQAALAACGHSAEAGGIIGLPRVEKRPLSVLVCPLRPDTMAVGPSAPSALLFLGDPDAALAPQQQRLTTVYGLTPAEARMVAALVDGERSDEYAERTGITVHTARTHLKSVFAKTGHSRQVNLVREILANPSLRADATDTMSQR